MGSAYTALAEGAGALAYNPAGMSSLKSVEVGFSHTNWLMDSKHDFVGIAVPVGHKMESVKQEGLGGMVMGVGLTRLTNASIETRNADRSLGGGFASYDQSISIGMARSFGKSRIGLGVKYIESVIADAKAKAGAVDLGYGRTLGRLPLSLGLAVQNLGTPMKYISQKDPLPLSFSAGMAVRAFGGFSLALDVRRLVYDKQNKVSIGTEYAVLSGFALRSGYMMGNSVKREADNGKNGFSLGAGLNFWNAQLDYAVTPYGELGNAQKITIKKQF